jgi:glycerol kinase
LPRIAGQPPRSARLAGLAPSWPTRQRYPQPRRRRALLPPGTWAQLARTSSGWLASGGIGILVVDIGSSAVRGSVVLPDATVVARRQQPFRPAHPAPGLVELDAGALAKAVVEVSEACLAEVGRVEGVGVTNQRGTTVVWDAASGEPVGPALSWQDLRTAGTCLELRAEGLRLAPNESATKVAWLLDTYDPRRDRDLRFGTLDSWAVWVLSEGRAHVTDPGNAGVSGLLPTEQMLVGKAGLGWDAERLERFRVPLRAMPVIVPSSGHVAEATALPGAPPICGIAGDQQASLMGQGCTGTGDAKLTCGTGAFLDVNIGCSPPPFGASGKSGKYGCLPILAWQIGDELTWGVEGLGLSAGSALSWFVDGLGLSESAPGLGELAANCNDTGDVWFVPAPLGLATPQWDFGARSLLIGMTTGTGRPEVARAALRGVAHLCADLLEAAVADSGQRVERLRADGGMTGNDVFVQELADACRVPVEVSAEPEATSLGVGFLAGLAARTWTTLTDVERLARPRAVAEPSGPDRRERWRQAVERARRWLPELSAVEF